MASTNERQRERQVVNEVSSDSVWGHTERIAREDRLSGSEGEARAVSYFQEVMEGLGLEVETFKTENYISLPLRASLAVLSPAKRVIPCITHSFSISTLPEGLESELVYVPRGADPDVRGRIVLNEGLAAPALSWHWEQKGAVGQVWINTGDLPRNMIITTVWGHPTPDTVQYIPRSAVASMNKAGGEYLKALCQRGPVRVRLETETWTGFKDVPLAVAHLRGRVEPEHYVLFNGHIDSWHKGATDNGTANACMLETARLLARHRDELRRGVRFIWWSGHSHGRYSGSTWYVDHYWEDLYRHAVVNVNVDSLGCSGATDYTALECSAELFEMGKGIIQEHTGQTPHYHRIGRSGDQSFSGVGIPALFQLLSRQPPEKEGPDTLIPGLAWFWHTEEDTIDKVDREILLRDTRIYMAALWRLCTEPVLPLNFVGVADEFIAHLSDLQKGAQAAFDLGPALGMAHRLKDKARGFRESCEEIAARSRAMSDPQADPALLSKTRDLNEGIIRLSRILMPVSYSAVDRFDLDRAMPIPPLPRLRPVVDLAAMDPSGADFKFLHRKMVRERNRVVHALMEALELIDGALERAQRI
jgi:hypothetical protein